MSPDQLADVPQHVLDYIAEHKTLTLASASSAGAPHATTLLYVNDGPTLYVWTKSSSTTAQHVDTNPAVGFTIDEYADDPSQTKGVQGTGECQAVLDGEEIARVADLFGRKFPSLAAGSSTMGISFFRVVPNDLQFIDNSGSAARGEDEFGLNYHRERVYSTSD